MPPISPHCYCFILTILLYTNRVNTLYQPVYFNEEEVRHVRAVTVPKPACEEQKFVDILAERQITNPEGIIGIAIADFEGTCAATTASIQKLDDVMSNCTAIPSLYTNLLNGLRTFDEKLCKNSAFYKKYDKFDNCYTDLDKDYDSCDGPPDWNESDEERACRLYKRIVDCYYIKTAKVCGIRAAMTLKELMVDVIDCTLSYKCSVSSNPKVKNAMPEMYAEALEKGRRASAAKIGLPAVFSLLLIASGIIVGLK